MLEVTSIYNDSRALCKCIRTSNFQRRAKECPTNPYFMSGFLDSSFIPIMNFWKMAFSADLGMCMGSDISFLSPSPSLRMHINLAICLPCCHAECSKFLQGSRMLIPPTIPQ